MTTFMPDPDTILCGCGKPSDFTRVFYTCSECMGEWEARTRWTPTAPTETGYYWAYENQPEEDADVLIVKVSDFRKVQEPTPLAGRIVYSSLGGSSNWRPEDFSCWMGPLEMPDPPKEIP